MNDDNENGRTGHRHGACSARLRAPALDSALQHLRQSRSAHLSEHTSEPAEPLRLHITSRSPDRSDRPSGSGRRFISRECCARLRYEHDRRAALEKRATYPPVWLHGSRYVEPLIQSRAVQTHATGNALLNNLHQRLWPNEPSFEHRDPIAVDVSHLFADRVVVLVGIVNLGRLRMRTTRDSDVTWNHRGPCEFEYVANVHKEARPPCRNRDTARP